MYQAVHAYTVSEIIVQRILDEISTGKLRPGDGLPPQRELARQMGVSMSSLREALRSLQAMGILEIYQGVGTRVSASPLNPIVKSLDWPAFLGRDQLSKIVEARYVLDPGVARVAALRATDEQIAEMSRLLDTMADAFRHNDARRFEEADVQFHAAMASATDNPLLVGFARVLVSALETFIKAIPHTAAGFRYHFEILDAIREHNPTKAEAAMRRLLSVSEMHLQGEPCQPGNSIC